MKGLCPFVSRRSISHVSQGRLLGLLLRSGNYAVRGTLAYGGKELGERMAETILSVE